MEVNGQRHAPAALYPRGNNPQYPLDRRLGGPQSRSGQRTEEKNPLTLPGIEPRSPGRPARNQTLYCLSYPAPRMSHVLSVIAANIGNLALCFRNRIATSSDSVARRGRCYEQSYTSGNCVPPVLTISNPSLCVCFSYDSYCERIISLNSINKLIFVMVKCSVLFEVRTEFLNI
jgi:hypothetical protein